MKFAIIRTVSIVNNLPVKCYSLELSGFTSPEAAQEKMKDWAFKDRFIITPYWECSTVTAPIEPPQYPQPTVDAIVASTNV